MQVAQVCTGAISLSLEYSASQVSRQVLSLLVWHPRIPDEPPERRSRVVCMVSLCQGLVAFRFCRSHAGLARGFVALLRMASVRFLGCPLSRRCGSPVPCPAGSLTARVAKMVGRLPCRSVLLSLSLSPSLSVSGSFCQFVSSQPISAGEPHPNCDLPFPPPHGVSQSRQK